MARVFKILVGWAACLTLIVACSTMSAFGQEGARVSGNESNRPLINAALDLINSDRSKHRSPPLQENAALSHVAQVYAEYLLRTGFFGHVDPFGRNPEQRAQYLGVMVPVSENLAWESSSYEAPDVLIKRAEAGMMDEPPNQPNHRYNILNPESNFVGIGIARAGDKVVMVQEFSSIAPDATASNLPPAGRLPRTHL